MHRINSGTALLDVPIGAHSTQAPELHTPGTLKPPRGMEELLDDPLNPDQGSMSFMLNHEGGERQVLNGPLTVFAADLCPQQAQQGAQDFLDEFRC